MVPGSARSKRGLQRDEPQDIAQGNDANEGVTACDHQQAFDPSPLSAAMLEETLAYSKEWDDVGKAVFSGRDYLEAT